MPTREELNQAKQEFSLLTLTDIEKFNLKDLSKTARSIGIRVFESKEGNIYTSKVSSRTKKALVSTVWAELEDFRNSRITTQTQTQGTIVREVPYQSSNALQDSIWADLCRVCDKYLTSTQEDRGVTLAADCATLGAALASHIKLIPHYRTGELKGHHAHISDYREACLSLENRIAQEPIRGKIMEECYPYLKSGANKILKETFDIKKDERARKELEIRQSDSIEINVEPFLTWARNILAKTPSEPKRGYWRDVAIALAITTGRRMNELFHVSTSFEKINDDWVWFSGQSKGKTYSAKFYEKFPQYAIPVHAPADTVIKGWQYLIKCGLQVEERRAVNKLYSKNLGSYFRNVKAKTGIPAELTFHEQRDIYAQIALKIPAIEEVYQTIPHADKREADYACYLLGEGRAVYGERYQLQKNLAFLSYMDKYLVKQ